MRFLILALLAILLLPFDASRVRADEVKYKSRDREPPSNRDDGVYKRQPDNHPSDPEPPQPPPPWHNPVNLPCPPRYCPPPGRSCEPGSQAGAYFENPLIDPISMTLNSVLSEEMALMQAEGFVGQVVVGYGRQIEFQRNDEWRRYDIGAVAESFTAWAVYQ